MSTEDRQQRIVPSVLDRLLVPEEWEQGDESTFGWYEHLRRLKSVVRRDLEALLNTRQLLAATRAAANDEVQHSILTYGLPDFSALNVSSQSDRHVVRQALERAIRIFEPRLDPVRVVMEETDVKDRRLRFRIEAVLQVQPTPEPVTFDAVLQVTTQEYRVERQD